METTPATPNPSSLRKMLDLTREAAADVLKRRTRLLRVVQQSGKKLLRYEGALQQVTDDLRALIRLTNAWAHREYQLVPWRSMLYIVAALIYFLNPIDLIPDALVGIGFVDDMAVIAAVVRSVRVDLDAFRAWERKRAGEVIVEVTAAPLPPAKQDRPPKQNYSASR